MHIGLNDSMNTHRDWSDHAHLTGNSDPGSGKIWTDGTRKRKRFGQMGDGFRWRLSCIIQST
jgi:hypothetical protein